MVAAWREEVLTSRVCVYDFVFRSVEDGVVHRQHCYYGEYLSRAFVIL